MRRGTTLVLVLVLAVAVAAVAGGGCGGPSGEERAALRAALDSVETKVDALYTAMETGGTVADLKAAKDQIAPEWQAVVTAAEPFEDADIPALEKAWEDASAAIDAVPDDATLAQVALRVMGPVQALLVMGAELRMMAGPSE